jgi:large subunit ribosomal protein L24
MMGKVIHFKVKSGDQVVVISGSARGETGEIMKVDKANQKVLVRGVKMCVRHTKPSAQNPKGERKEKESFIHISNVALFEPKLQRASRVGMRLKDGVKVRYFKRSGEEVNG